MVIANEATGKAFKIAVLHNKAEARRIKQLLLTAPGLKSTVSMAADQFKSMVDDMHPQIAIVGKWSEESRIPEMLQWALSHEPNIKLLAHATKPEEIAPALLAGANGYVYQNNLECIGEGVEKVMEGGFYIPSGHGQLCLDQLLEMSRLFQTFVNGGITPRELEFIRGQMQARTREEAADRMCVELTTVKSHNRQILRKLGMKRMKDVIGLYRRCLEGYPPAAEAGG